MPYNRAVKDLNGRSVAEFIARLKAPSRSSRPMRPSYRRPATTSACIWTDAGTTCTQKTAIVNEADTVDRLDVSILQNNLLDPLLGIHDPRTDKRIHFVGGIRGNDELVKLVDSASTPWPFRSTRPRSAN